jgi:hypothetical protein
MSFIPHPERRTEAYAFNSLKELMVHYSDFLPMGRIEQNVRECAVHFSARRDATRGEERLQFIARCEKALKADLALLQEAFSRKDGREARDVEIVRRSSRQAAGRARKREG